VKGKAMSVQEMQIEDNSEYEAYQLQLEYQQYQESPEFLEVLNKEIAGLVAPAVCFDLDF
jgi:hypothetical protein